MNRKIVSLIICLFGLVYAIVETWFFGSHFLPACPEEVLADGIALAITCFGLSLAAKEGK